jgi:RNA polymerase sigma factor (sigma-70 family)
MTAAQFNKCVDDYADGLYRFILKNIKDEDDARDVVQDSFEKMWKNHANVDASKCKSYLFTTGYHTMIDRIKKKKQTVDYSEVDEANLFNSQPYSDVKKIVNEAVNLLPSQQKAVITLRDFEGYNYKEIGEITGLSESQVKVYIYRARTFLKEYIGSMENVI